MTINHKTPTQFPAASEKLPVCNRNLSFDKDGAKYYNPVSLKTKDKTYNPNEMREISLDIINRYAEKNKLNPNKSKHIKLSFDKDYIDEHKNQEGEIGLFTAWLDDLQAHLLSKVSNDLNLDKKNIQSNIYLFYRNPKGQEHASGIFHEDGMYDKNQFMVQMIYPLDKTEMGTLFVPDKYKEHFTNIHPRDKNFKGTKAYVYNAKNKIGIAEQADPDKIFAMLRHTHPKGVIHAVPKATIHGNKPIMRPLLTFEFY